MYTGMYSCQQEATNKRLVRLFELITNIFIKCLKPYKLFPLLKVFLIGKFYQREQWSWCSILSGKDPKFMIYKILTIWWFMKFYNWCYPFSINVVIQYLLQYVKICSIVSKNKINVQNTKESNKWPKILISWS